MTEFAEFLASALEGQAETPRDSSYERSLRTFEVAVAALLPAVRHPAVLPRWAIELGVDLPCTVDEVRRAFRRRAFDTHPDREGGSHEAFLAVQTCLEEALASVGARSSERSVSERRAYARSPERTSGAGFRSTYG